MATLSEWAHYARWSSAIAAEFFAGQFGGRPVYIDLEDEVLVRIAQAVELAAFEEPEQALIDVVRPTLGLADGQSLFGAHVRRLTRWRRGDRESPPPVIGVLAFQSLVAERMRGDEEFRPTNYYGRFIRMLGRDPGDARLRAKTVRGFAEHSGLMWAALNQWLDEDHETRGIPTAFSFDYRIHVGVPMSQALVRASDRDAIRQLFSDLAMSPGQVIAVDDMARLLEAWLPDSRVSASLRRLCEQPDVLTRVAEVVCIELQAWTGTVHASAPRNRSMALVASLRRLPRRSLKIGLAIRAAQDLSEVQVGPLSDDAARAAAAQTDGQLLLGAPDADGWRRVTSPLAAADLLFARMRVSAEGLRAERDPRTIVVLAKNDDGSGYQESERVRLGSEHLVLVVEAARGRVGKELARIARPGFRAHERLPGLPAGWVLFESVEIMAISDTGAADMAVLIPLAWTEVAIEGGLKLAGRATWHSSSAPEVRASAPPGRRVALAVLSQPEGEDQDGEHPAPELEPETDEHPRLVPAALVSFERAGLVSLVDEGLDDGDYRVQLFEEDLNGKALSAVTFRLRSASSPTPPSSWPILAYPRGEASGTIGARAGLAGIQGARVGAPAAASPPLAAPSEVVLADAMSPLAAEEDEEYQEEIEPAGSERVSEVPRCFIDGSHHFVLQDAGRELKRWERRPIEGACKHCDLEARFPARPLPANTGRAEKRLRAALPSMPAVPLDEPLDYDVLLDALCWSRSGSLPALRQLVSQRDDRPWATAEAARRLSALGHLDVEIDAQLRPRSWSVAPSALVATTGSAYLAGWRSAELLYELGRAARAADGRVEWIEQAGGPVQVAVVGVDDDDLDAVAAMVSDTGNWALSVERDVPTRIAAWCASADEIREALQVLAAPPARAPMQRLDETHLRWVPSTSIARSGAYRTTQHPRVTMHSNGIDWRIVDARLAKWLAVPRPSLIAYEPSSQTVTCHRGAEPPGLLERALVTCSGQLPSAVSGHRVQYHRVPRGVAATVASFANLKAAGNG